MPGNIIARELIPWGGGGLGATLQQFAWPEALQSFFFGTSVDNSDNVKHQRDIIPPSHQPGWLE